MKTSRRTVCDDSNGSSQSLSSQPVVHILSHGFFKFFLLLLEPKRMSLHCEPSSLMLSNCSVALDSFKSTFKVNTRLTCCGTSGKN